MEKQFEKLSLDDFDPQFTQYTIKTKSCEDQKICLPFPKDISFLIKLNTIKNQISFDEETFKKFIKSNNIIDLTLMDSIQNINILKSVLFFLGGINTETLDIGDIYNYLPDTDLLEPIDENYFQNMKDFFSYVDINKKYILELIKTKDLNNFFESLKNLGFSIEKNKDNLLYTTIKTYVMNKDKIYIIIAPSDNFWIKSDKNVIGNVQYNQKLNNITNVFYNKDFIVNFFNKIIKHPRCNFGFISSMLHKNLHNVIEGFTLTYMKEIGEVNLKDLAKIDQKYQINLNEGKNQVPIFLRDFNKIKEYILRVMKRDCFNETNILILDAEPTKISENTMDNSIVVKLFNEENILNEERKEKRKELENKVIDYCFELLEECVEDIRAYIKKNPLNL
jgi:hypothetical protein